MRRYRRVVLIVALAALAITATPVWWFWFRADYSWLGLQDDPMKRLATVLDLAPQKANT